MAEASEAVSYIGQVVIKKRINLCYENFHICISIYGGITRPFLMPGPRKCDIVCSNRVSFIEWMADQFITA